MKKFSKNHIFASLIIDLFYVFIIALAFVDFAFISNEEGEYVGVNYQALPYYIALLVVAYILFTVYRIIYVHTSGYQLTEREIVCNRGVLFRKKSILEYSKINSINKKQNFIQRIFGIAVLTVDSGSANMGHLPEIIVIEKNDVVDQLLNKLKNIDKAKIEPEKQEVIQ